jgi:hypothetical protein
MASSNRNRKFTWTHETRLAVHQLDTEFAFDLKQKTKIFSLLFPREFIDDGKMSIRIKSQTAEWKKTPPKRSNTWTAVLRTSSTAEVERTDMQIRIRKAAAEAGISSDVSRGASGVHGHNDDGNDNLSMDSRRELTPLSRKRRYAYQTPTSMEDESESNDELESENISMRPKRRRAWNNNDQHQAQVRTKKIDPPGKTYIDMDRYRSLVPFLSAAALDHDPGRRFQHHEHRRLVYRWSRHRSCSGRKVPIWTFLPRRLHPPHSLSFRSRKGWHILHCLDSSIDTG